MKDNQEESTGGARLNMLLKIVSLILLTVNSTALPLVARYSRIRLTNERFYTTTTVFFTEIGKLLTCIFIIIWQEKSFFGCALSIYDAIVRNPRETLKVCIPSMMYTVQNNLYYIGLSNLDAATFAVTSQLKILTTAFFFVLILRRAISRIQWCSLALLACGVALVQIQQQMQNLSIPSASTTAQVMDTVLTNSSTVALSSVETGHPQGGNPVIGLAAVITECIMSGFAGIYFEKVLKSSSTSVWMQNVRLAMLGVPLCALLMFAKDGRRILANGILFGYDGIVWSVVIMNGSSGLIIAVVIKYADNILKSYAQSVAIVFACLGSSLLFGLQPTVWFLAGACCVAVSVVMFNKYPPAKSQTAEIKNVTSLQPDNTEPESSQQTPNHMPNVSDVVKRDSAIRSA